MKFVAAYKVWELVGEEKDDGRDDQGRRGQIGMHFEKITGMDWWRSEKYDDTDEGYIRKFID